MCLPKLEILDDVGREGEDRLVWLASVGEERLLWSISLLFIDVRSVMSSSKTIYRTYIFAPIKQQQKNGNNGTTNK